MHICFISDGLYRYLLPQDGQASGGAERQQHMLATRLSRRGHTVSAIVGSDISEPKTVDGITVVSGCPSSISGPQSIVSAAQSLYTAMKSIDADIYYVRGAPRLFFVVSIFARLLHSNVLFNIANESDLDPAYLQSRYGSLFFLFYRWAVKHTDICITQTETQRRMLLSYFDRDATTIPNGYSLLPKSEIQDHSERSHVLWVGRSHKTKKKPMRFVSLAASCPNIPFVMISQPSGDQQYHEKLMQRASMVDNLRFVGPVAPDQIHEYYNDATLLVNTSDYEGFPNTYLEAWRYETPVVTLFHDIDDLIKSHNIGVVAGSMQSLVDEVDALHNNLSRRIKMGQNARKYITNNHRMDHIVDQYESTLQGYLNERR